MQEPMQPAWHPCIGVAYRVPLVFFQFHSNQKNIWHQTKISARLQFNFQLRRTFGDFYLEFYFSLAKPASEKIQPRDTSPMWILLSRRTGFNLAAAGKRDWAQEKRKSWAFFLIRQLRQQQQHFSSSRRNERARKSAIRSCVRRWKEKSGVVVSGARAQKKLIRQHGRCGSSCVRAANF